MLNIDQALNDDRLMKAVTGFSSSEFNKLTESFGGNLKMKRRIGMKQESNLGIGKEIRVVEE